MDRDAVEDPTGWIFEGPLYVYTFIQIDNVLLHALEGALVAHADARIEPDLLESGCLNDLPERGIGRIPARMGRSSDSRGGAIGCLRSPLVP